MSTIAVVGAGHVGVVYAAGLAELGHIVRVIDIDTRRVAGLRKGRIWFYEPGLPELLARGLQRRRITFTTSFRVGLSGARFIFVCVPTPAGADGSLDDVYLRSAFARIQRDAPRPRPVVVNKSTVPVGTGDAMVRIFEDGDIRVVCNPEFLSEGRAVEDFFRPSRIVIGSRDRLAADAVAKLYAPLRAPIVFTDPVTAEFSKLAANAFLATKVSFVNVVSQIGEAIGADCEDLTRVLSLDPRIGSGHLRPGLGFGGSCLPKDLAAMESLARKVECYAELFATVSAINRGQRDRVVTFLRSRLGELAGRRVGVLGAAFKANTDDLRESPATLLARELAGVGAEVVVHDPAAGKQLKAEANGMLKVARSPMAAARKADALVFATEWPEFAALDLNALRRVMRGRLLVDARGVVDPAGAARARLELFSFSRPPSVLETLAQVDSATA